MAGQLATALLWPGASSLYRFDSEHDKVHSADEFTISAMQVGPCQDLE